MPAQYITTLHTPEAKADMLRLTSEQTDAALHAVAEAITNHADYILQANATDLAAADPADYRYDRLRLDPARLDGMTAAIRSVAMLPTPLGRVLNWDVRDNGMVVRRISVPLGVVGVIYEARPNVTTDVFSLCFKSGNVCLLKGSSDARHTNAALVAAIHQGLAAAGIPTRVVSLLPPERTYTEALMQAEGTVDVLIPRGGAELISRVRRESRIPVIETGAAVCHTYYDATASLPIGQAVIHNAKTRRVSVCNSLDTLLIHRDRLPDLPTLCAPLATSGVTIFADAPAHAALQGRYPQEQLRLTTIEETARREFLDYKMNIFTVASLPHAIDHINQVAGRHSEAIITTDPTAAATFKREVDAACVYVNVPTSFTDGGMFGLGAEVGISTQKLHARGPMGLEALTTTKWIIEGEGQTRG